VGGENVCGMVSADRVVANGWVGCPETSVRNYHYSPLNNPEERSSRVLRGGSLKSRIGHWMSVCLLFVVDEVALGQVFLPALRVFPASLIRPVLHATFIPITSCNQHIHNVAK
jgi:hypothetical protein